MLWCGAVLALAVAGCSKGPGSIQYPAPGRTVAEFPSAAFPDSLRAPSDPAPDVLAVVRAEPRGEVHGGKVVTVAFNQDVGLPGLGAPADDAPLTFSPPIAGTFHWWGRRTLAFRPTQPLPPSTTFVARVPAGTKAASGATLDRDFAFSFKTAGLEVSQMWFGPSYRLTPDSKLYVSFNLDVPLDRVQEHVRLTDDRGKEWPITLAPVVTTTDGVEVASRRAFVATPESPLELGRTFQLIVGAEMSTGEGAEPLGREQRKSMSSFGRLRVDSISCGWRDDATCQSYDRVQVAFSNPVDPQKALECVSISPGGKPELSYADASTLYLRPRTFVPGGSYSVKVSGACEDTLGTTLSNAKSRRFKVADRSPYVSFRSGFSSIEPEPAGKPNILPVSHVNARPMTLRMKRVTPEILAEVASALGNWDYSRADAIVGDSWDVETRMSFPGKKNTAGLSGIDLTRALGKGRPTGIVYVRLENADQNHWALVSVTDMGLTIKAAPDATGVWVTGLADTAPAGAVDVGFYTARGELLGSATTSDEGWAEGPGVVESGESNPRYVVARKGDSIVFANLEDYELRMAAYDFGLPFGWESKATSTVGSVFTERGVYRHGETVHVKGIVRTRSREGLALTDADRVAATVFDARGNVVLRDELELTPLGGFDVEVPIDRAAPLGSWRVEARPIARAGAPTETLSGFFRVEAYRPPRFEVRVTPSEEAATLGGTARATIEGRYLFGAPMRGAKVRYDVSRAAGSFSSEQFPGFTFGSPVPWWEYRGWNPSEYLLSKTTTLDAEGRVEVAVEVKPSETITGPQSLRIDAEVTDVDSQSLSSSRSITVHPADVYVGLGDFGWLHEEGASIDVPVAAVTTSGEAAAPTTIEVALKRRVWTYALKASAGGGSTWVSEHTDSVVDTCAVTSSNGLGACGFTPKTPGSYVVEASARDAKGRESLSSTSFYVYGGGSGSWWARSNDSKIQLVPDARSYQVGDVARVMVPSPFQSARALVTVEREGILSRQVVEVNGNAHTLEIPITEEMIPNAYLSVALVRGRVKGPDVKAVDKVDPGKPAFKLGYIPLAVDASSRALAVEVKAERETYRPGERVDVSFTLRDASGAPTSGEVTFMAVDEGVLSLTGYRTPELGKRFYANVPLPIATLDTRRNLASKVEAKSLSGNKGDPGGDGGGANYRAAFASTAAFVPTLTVDASGQARTSFELPDNLTAFRLMAVAVGPGHTFGSADSRVTVNKPLIARPGLPRFASMGDTFGARVVIQSLDGFAGDVTVTASARGPISLAGETTKTFALAAGQARAIEFPASADGVGDATVAFAVEGEGASDAVEITLPVKYPAATRRHVESAKVYDGGDPMWRRYTPPKGSHPTAGELEIELSSSQFSELLPGLDYLIDYPYGCVEQTTGRTLPMASLKGTLEQYEMDGLGGSLTTYTEAGVARLFSMQTSDGGLGYWPGARESHPWGSVYGGLAIVRAKAAGMKVDEARLARLTAYLSELSRSRVRPPDHWDAGAMLATSAFASYVLAEAGAVDASYNEMLYNRRDQLPVWARALLLMAIWEQKGGGPLTDRRKEMARTLYASIFDGVEETETSAHLRDDVPGERRWVTMSSDVRTDAIALMALLRYDPQDPLTAKFAQGLLDARRGSRWISTQSNAFAVMALAEYFETIESVTPDYDVTVAVGDKVVALESFKGRELTHKRVRVPLAQVNDATGGLITVMRSGEGGPLHVNLALSYHPEEPPTEPTMEGFALERAYFYADGERAGEPVVGAVDAGTLVRVRLTLVSDVERHYVALEDPLPAGLEPVNLAFATTSRRAVESMQDRDPDWYWRSWWRTPRFDHVEQRDDRVLLFANVLSPGVYSHSYLARATTRGAFTAPAAQVEEMYAPYVRGGSAARSLSVE
jgi:hypothetical protein